MVGCPLLCSFCPQESLKSAYLDNEKYLSIENFKIILANLPIDTRIDFSGMSEPWANPNATAFLSEALKRGFKVAVYTPLYGMKKEDGDEVKKLLENFSESVEEFVIHLPDANNNMLGWKKTSKWDYAFEKLSGIKLACGVKRMTMDKNGRVHPSIAHLVPELASFSPIDRAGSLPENEVFLAQDNEPQKLENDFPLFCKSSPFYDRNVVLPNGDILICCMDYSKKHVIGNLLDQSMVEILNGEALSKIIDDNELDGYVSSSICKQCNNVARLNNNLEVHSNALRRRDRFLRKLGITPKRLA